MFRVVRLRLLFLLLILFIGLIQCAHSPEQAQIEEGAIQANALKTSQQSSIQRLETTFQESVSIDPDNIDSLESYSFDLKFPLCS